MSLLEVLTLRDPLTESNCYVLASEGRCAVVDPNCGELLLETLRKRALTLERIFLTHEHCDHIVGLETLRAAFPGAQLLISRECSEGIQDARLNLSSIMEMYLLFRGGERVPYAPFTCAPAEQVFSGACEISWQGHSFRLLSLPGHSPGSTGVFLDDHAFFSGDYLLPGEDVILRFPGGDEEAYYKTTKPILDGLPEGLTIYPGHGDSYVLSRS